MMNAAQAICRINAASAEKPWRAESGCVNGHCAMLGG